MRSSVLAGKTETGFQLPELSAEIEKGEKKAGGESRLFTKGAAAVAFNGISNGNGQFNKRGNGRKFAYCPYCDKKGLYKVPRSYERCRYCGLYRILLPGQDF